MEVLPRAPHDPEGGMEMGEGGSGRSTRPGVEPGFLTRFFLLFTSPGAAFRPPRGLAFWLTPLLVILVFGVVHDTLLQDLYNEWFLEMVDTSTAFSDEQRSLMLESIESRMDEGVTIASILQTAAGAIGSLGVSVFLLALFYLVGVNFGLAGSARYLDVVGVLTLSGMVLVVRNAITLPLKLSQGTIAIYTGPAALVEHDGSLLPTILGFFDLFDLFRLFLLVIGLAVVGHVSTTRSAILVIAFWLLGCGFRLIWALSPLAGLAP